MGKEVSMRGLSPRAGGELKLKVWKVGDWMKACREKSWKDSSRKDGEDDGCSSKGAFH